jgi:O-antigen/teichoic acid export membrane protein
MRIIKQYKSSEFIKNIAVVISGTAISQIISIAITPILTRNYTPEDFGFYTTFIAIYSLLCSFATGKFERVILLSKDIKDIIIVSSLCLLTSLVFSFTCLFLFFIASLVFDFGKWGIEILLFKWLYIIPAFLIIYAVNTVFLTFLNYEKNFKEISKSRVIKTFVSISVSVTCIYFLKDMGGLILGEILGLFISTIYLFPKLKFLFQFKKEISSHFYNFIIRYRNFPLYNIPTDLLNNSSSQVPVFFLSPIYGVNVTGQYSLMKRMLDAPVTLLSSSVLEVFRQKASEQFIKNGDCRNLLLKTAKNLALISIVPFSILFVFGSDIFVLIFGEKWRDAGQFASIFSVFYFFKFISSPISYVFYIAEKQKIDFLLHIYIFLSSLLFFILPKFFSISITETLWMYSINFVLIYITYLLLSYKYSVKC